MNGKMVDLYCERLGPGLWAEPFNLLTNLSFIIAAVAIWLMAGRFAWTKKDVILLCLLILAIAIGSSLLHTFATFWARYLDEVPILLFQLCFLWLYGRNIARLSAPLVLVLLVVYLSAVIFGRVSSSPLNASQAYFPALITLFLFSGVHYYRASHERFILLWATALFALSLYFRSMDLPLCDVMPVGTHFLWHLCNGLVLYLVSRGYLLNRIKEA